MGRSPQDIKLRREARKLALEITELRRPLYRRPQAWLGAATVVGIFITATLQLAVIPAEHKGLRAAADKAQAELILAQVNAHNLAENSQNAIEEAREKERLALDDVEKLRADITDFEAQKKTLKEQVAELTRTSEGYDKKITTKEAKLAALEEAVLIAAAALQAQDSPESRRIAERLRSALGKTELVSVPNEFSFDIFVDRRYDEIRSYAQGLIFEANIVRTHNGAFNIEFHFHLVALTDPSSLGWVTISASPQRVWPPNTHVKDSGEYAGVAVLSTTRHWCAVHGDFDNVMGCAPGSFSGETPRLLGVEMPQYEGAEFVQRLECKPRGSQIMRCHATLEPLQVLVAMQGKETTPDPSSQGDGE